MKKQDKLDVIKCPFCGREYLPAEIFVDREFLGRPTDIDRNVEGQITSFQGKTMDLNEEYICDKCHEKFKVSAKVSFKAFIDPKDQFDTEYVSPLREVKLSLFED